MRTINLLIHQQSLMQLCDQTELLCNLYGKHEANCETKVTKPKEEEDLSALVEEVLKHTGNADQMDLCHGYYWNYTIPRIGKEFDLIRIGVDYLVNIEIKSVATIDKMEAHLIKNRKYLKIMGRPVYLFTFISSDRSLYTLEEDNFREASYEELITLLENQKLDDVSDIDEVFSPFQFLISPFNNTEKFLNDEYFLTTQQEKIYSDITMFTSNYHEILGRVGTGKSLLLYHIAKQLMLDPSYEGHVAIVHCGVLNDGHRNLQKHGYAIYDINEWLKRKEQIDCKVLCIDEFQRLNNKQAELLMEHAEARKMKVILSVDPVQVFMLAVKEEPPYQRCKEKYGFVEYRVSDHIRSNPDISRFSKDVMNLNEHHGKIASDHIRIHGTDTMEEAQEMIAMYQREGYRFLHYITSGFQESLLQEGDIHQVIGQEYDKVVTILDDAFFYNEERMLDASNRDDTKYLRAEMFYEAITRARKDLAVIVVHNPSVFTTVLMLFR